ncbi:MAG: 1-acyl-sn-glycerol-3-phosphate acyltransferase [Bacteroidales bacterium]|nr:1-acyl-sn-glycerol-3-phosphate acyltransferase [Bacteroidales bacterium]
MRGTVKQARLNFTERFLRGFSWCVVKTVHRPCLHGPKPVLDEPTIFVCRHVGMMDPVILMVEYYNMMIRPLVARDYYDANGFTRKFYPIAQCIPIERRRASTEWLEASLEALGKGESVIIFPEGKRNKSGDGLLPFHSGAALLAARSGARIVPVWNAVWKFPHRYHLAIGEPIHLDPLPETGESADWLRDQTKKIQAAVASLESRF